MDIRTLPQQFLDNMHSLMGDEEYERYIAHMSSASARRGLRVNTLKISTEEFENIFPYPTQASPFCPEGYYLPEDRSYGTHPYHHAGLFYMQEPSAMSVITALRPYIGNRVLDMCSAPGGKATYLGSLMKNKGVLVLNEIVFQRAKILESNIERMGIRNAVITNNSPKDIERLLPEYFDTVVVDAPCSGEGMFLKEEAAVKAWNMNNVLTCAARQYEILSSAYNTLQCGGYLVYSTCTLNRYENEEVIERFLASHNDMETVPVCDSLKNVTPAGFAPVDNAIRIFPHNSVGEGHFVCLMHKRSGGINNMRFTDAFEPLKSDSEFRDLFSKLASIDLYGKLGKYKDRVFILPDEIPYVKGINVIKCGVAACDIVKGRIEPLHNLVTALYKGETHDSIDLHSDSTDIMKFLKGETLTASPSYKGYCVLTVDGYPLSLVKAVNGTIKNHYPKGLRNLK